LVSRLTLPTLGPSIILSNYAVKLAQDFETNLLVRRNKSVGRCTNTYQFTRTLHAVPDPKRGAQVGAPCGVDGEPLAA